MFTVHLYTRIYCSNIKLRNILQFDKNNAVIFLLWLILITVQLNNCTAVSILYIGVKATIKSKEEKKKSESESITFRIPSKLLNELRREAEKKQVSLSTLTNQVFTRPIA
jgi:hypothetical protein